MAFRKNLYARIVAIAVSAAVVPSAALATASAPVTLGGSVLSYGGSVALVGSGGVATGYGVAKPNAWSIAGGVLALAGGFAIGFVGPSPATFFDGSATFHYDPTLFHVNQVGWLGDWGLDPSKAAPPVDPNLWDNLTVFLQSPAAGLNATVTSTPAAGILTVNFSWGANGKAA